MILEIISSILIGLGTLFVLVGGVGFFRFPDFFTRVHAASLTDTAGAGLFLLGLAVHSGLTLATVKLLFILFFFFFTSPTGTYAVTNSAVRFGLKPWARSEKEHTDG